MDIFDGLDGLFSLLGTRGGAKFVSVLLLLGIPIAVALYYWNKPVRETQAIVTLQSHIACHPEAEVEPIETDYWDRDITTESIKDGNGSVFCTVSSAGRDGVFDTDDDIVARYKDINKSRVAGAWMKAKGAEAIKGMIFGDRRDETGE